MAGIMAAGRPPRVLQAQGRRLVLASLVLLTVGAWAVTISQAQTMDMPMGIAVRGANDTPMAGMPMDAAETGAMGGMASASMAAMMFPAAAPMLFFHATATRRRAARGLDGDRGGDVAACPSRQRGGEPDERGEHEVWAPLALGGVLLLAGLYQFTPLKRACLRQCQAPLGFVMTHWREGRLGALRMGILHGALCLGCCWALFAVLVATGVMSLAWMLLPLGPRVAWVIGGVLLVLGGIVAAGALDLPWMA